MTDISPRASRIISWLRDYGNNRIDSRLMDKRQCIPPHIVLNFGNEKLFGMMLPNSYGGLSLSYFDSLKIFEQIAAIDLSLAAFVSNNTLAI